jgi:hypothetical protein
MNAQEKENELYAKMIARLDTDVSEPAFYGWYPFDGKWFGWYQGGRVVWLKDDNFGFVSP